MFLNERFQLPPVFPLLLSFSLLLSLTYQACVLFPGPSICQDVASILSLLCRLLCPSKLETSHFSLVSEAFITSLGRYWSHIIVLYSRPASVVIYESPQIRRIRERWLTRWLTQGGARNAGTAIDYVQWTPSTGAVANSKRIEPVIMLVIKAFKRGGWQSLLGFASFPPSGDAHVVPAAHATV